MLDVSLLMIFRTNQTQSFRVMQILPLIQSFQACPWTLPTLPWWELPPAALVTAQAPREQKYLQIWPWILWTLIKEKALLLWLIMRKLILKCINLLQTQILVQNCSGQTLTWRRSKSSQSSLSPPLQKHPACLPLACSRWELKNSTQPMSTHCGPGCLGEAVL